MVEIPDMLRCLFSAEIKQRDGSFVIEVPKEEIDEGDITTEEIYRVAILPTSGQSQQQSRPQEQLDSRTETPQRPPVSEGEQRTVTIETTGDQGDGIAKVERGYVVIVPGTVPGDELEVEMQMVKQNFAIAEVVDGDELTYE
jgi:predicted RNA-binding protein with TRAM domain